VRSHCVDLVNKILNTLKSVSSELLLDLRVIDDGDSLSVDLGKSSLVDEFLDGLKVGVSVSDVRLNKLEHVKSSLVQSKEGGIVDLSQSEELKDLSGLRVKSVDTSNSNNNSELRFGLKEEVSVSSGSSSKSDQ